MKATIKIRLKNGVLDPQGKAIKNALTQLSFGGVEDIRQGKLIEVELTETNAQKAHNQLTKMCEMLLANTVIENYDIEIETAS